jgi:hypothetical protein
MAHRGLKKARAKNPGAPKCLKPGLAEAARLDGGAGLHPIRCFVGWFWIALPQEMAADQANQAAGLVSGLE